MRAALLIFALALLHAGEANAASMRVANDAYARGDWGQAAAHYQALVDDGVSHETLFYNLGNAYFRTGNHGSAMFAYERALRVAPGFGNALYNLRLTRNAVSQRTTNQLHDADAVSWWLKGALAVPISWSTLWLLISNGLLFGVLANRRNRQPSFRRRLASVGSVLLATSVLASALLLAGHVHVNESIYHGVVVGDLVIMREGPDSALEERGQLHPGLRITVISEEPEWLLVRLGNGVEGWVPRAQVGLFR